MTILRLLFIVVLTALLLVVHWIGSRRAEVAKGLEPEASTPVPRKEVDPYKKLEAEPQPEPTPLLPQPDPPTRVPPKLGIALIDGYTSEHSVRRTQVHFLPCHGGPNDERCTIFPVDPTAALKIGSMAVFVTGFEPYKHAELADSDIESKSKTDAKAKPATQKEPDKSESKIGFYIAQQDTTRMGIQGFSVYAIEIVDSVPRLAYVGTIDLLEYGRFLRLNKSVAMPGEDEPTDHIEIQTTNGGVRRLQVFQTKCVGGPADGKMYPLLTSPQILWQNGLTTVAVTEFGFRPKENSIGKREVPNTNFVGRINLYVLEETRDASHRFGRPTGFQLKFDLSLDAASYLKIHNRIFEE